MCFNAQGSETNHAERWADKAQRHYAFLTEQPRRLNEWCMSWQRWMMVTGGIWLRDRRFE